MGWMIFGVRWAIVRSIIFRFPTVCRGFCSYLLLLSGRDTRIKEGEKQEADRKWAREIRGRDRRRNYGGGMAMSS